MDEQTPPKPGSARGQRAAGGGTGLAGFRRAPRRCRRDSSPRRHLRAGPERAGSSRRGKARRIVKPGQIFNRIHVTDIAQAIDAAFSRAASGIFNVADDEPSPPADPIMFAAQLMGVAPPPEIAFADAAPSMSPMALSFWQECRRVRNDKLKRELGVALRYPTYREGLRALFAEQ